MWITFLDSFSDDSCYNYIYDNSNIPRYKGQR